MNPRGPAAAGSVDAMTAWPPANPLGEPRIITVADADELGALLTANPEIGVAAAIAAAVDDRDLELSGEFLVQLDAAQLPATTVVLAGYLLASIGDRYTPDEAGAVAYRAEVYPAVEGIDSAGPPWLRIAHETIAAYITTASTDGAAAKFAELAAGHTELDARFAVAYLLALAICTSGWAAEESDRVFWTLADMVRCA